jgi:hypothetical protein
MLLVEKLGILSLCQSLRDLERFATHHHFVDTVALCGEFHRLPSDSASCF